MRYTFTILAIVSCLVAFSNDGLLSPVSAEPIPESRRNQLTTAQVHANTLKFLQSKNEHPIEPEKFLSAIESAIPYKLLYEGQGFKLKFTTPWTINQSKNFVRESAYYKNASPSLFRVEKKIEIYDYQVIVNKLKKLKEPEDPKKLKNPRQKIAPLKIPGTDEIMVDKLATFMPIKQATCMVFTFKKPNSPESNLPSNTDPSSSDKSKSKKLWPLKRL
ncbi:hypothetical protein BDF19DRAFT_435631 [Syncephalis fuscata]|nr:hypothetical protein BDF19DRAFT_435620 [Syncephalis fuscata]KAI9597037.1 hypothetical protein BDF19DRAFT_435631 [Syncephalis fuscata]